MITEPAFLIKQKADRLEEENERLRELIKPFAYVARSIPKSYPEDCRLCTEMEHDQYEDKFSEYLGYHPRNSSTIGHLPFISQWRALLDVDND